MVDKIKEIIAKKYKLRDTKWLFVSWFDAAWKLLFSEWVVESDQSLDTTVDLLYKNYIASVTWIALLTLDVITTLYEETNITKIPVITPTLYWFALVDDHVMLRKGLSNLINEINGYCVIFESNNGKDFVSTIEINNYKFQKAVLTLHNLRYLRLSFVIEIEISTKYIYKWYKTLSLFFLSGVHEALSLCLIGQQVAVWYFSLNYKEMRPGQITTTTTNV